jgi:NodT family efflux transporter outer membrane factor (OMF) lipoprotein
MMSHIGRLLELARNKSGKGAACGASMIVAASMALCGCAVGPDFQAPAPPQTDGYLPVSQGPTTEAPLQDMPGQTLSAGQDLPAEWWKLYHNADLDRLIRQAIAANPDLKAARAAVTMALENVKAQQGAYFPTIAAGFNASRSQNSQSLAPTLNSGQLLFNLYQADVSANWTIDLWGGNRRAVEVLQAQADAQRLQLEQAYVALTTNIVVAAIQEASLREQIAAVNDIVRSESEALDILKRQASLGEIAGADVAAQEAALAQSQQLLPPLQKQLRQQLDLMAVLAGRLPTDPLDEHFVLSSLVLPREIPVSLPSKLVEHRSDIRIAEQNMRAANAQIGVAIANMLPNITLTAQDGGVDTAIGSLFTPASNFWTVGAGLSQLLFDGGALLHKSRAARAGYEEASAQYKSVVDTAFQNVADSLYALRFDASNLSAALASENAAADSLAIARRRLELGAISYVALLAAEQTYQQSVIARIQAQAARLTDTAVLFQALGGGPSDPLADAAPGPLAEKER